MMNNLLLGDKHLIRCRNCNRIGVVIETNKPGYGRYFWHQKCLNSWQEWVYQGDKPKYYHTPTRYLWQKEFDFDSPILIANKTD